MADAAVEIVGGTKVVHDLDGIASRLVDVAPALAERDPRRSKSAEAGVFAELGGRYIDTGAVGAR